MNAGTSLPSIITLLIPEHIVVGAQAANRKDLFASVGTLFAREGLSAATITQALETRETLGSTALGQGVAIPHGRIKHLDEARAAFLRTSPIDFGAPDQKPVDLFFVLLVPEHATDHHLQLLSELAQMVGDRAFRDGLRRAIDRGAVHALLQAQALPKP